MVCSHRKLILLTWNLIYSEVIILCLIEIVSSLHCSYLISLTNTKIIQQYRKIRIHKKREKSHQQKKRSIRIMAKNLYLWVWVKWSTKLKADIEPNKKKKSVLKNIWYHWKNWKWAKGQSCPICLHRIKMQLRSRWFRFRKNIDYDPGLNLVTI